MIAVRGSGCLAAKLGLNWSNDLVRFSRPENEQCLLLLEPVSFRCEVRDALSNLVPDVADNFDRLALGVSQGPVELLQARHKRASVSASHGDEQCSLPCQIL